MHITSTSKLASFFIKGMFLVYFIIQGMGIHAQEITKEYNKPIVDDILKGYTIDRLEVRGSKENCIWDLSNSTISENPIKEMILLKNDTSSIMATLIGNTLIYTNNIDRDTLERIGYENNLQSIVYEKPEITLVYPLHYGDSISGYIYGTGVFCDKLKLRSFGTYTLNVEKLGTIILPNGKQLKKSLLIHTKRYISTEKYPLNYAIPSYNDFTQDSIEYYINLDNSLLCQEEYNIYSKGYRYPIIKKYITYFTKQGRKSLKTKIIFYNPEEQNMLALDEKNKLLQQTENQENNYDEYKSLTDDSIIEYKITQNKENKILQLTYNLKECCDVTIIIADANGMCHKQTTIKQSAEKDHTMEIDYHSLPSIGPIILYINVKGQLFCEKFNQ